MLETLSSTSTQSAEFLRVASIVLATYEYILTLPAEYRFYKAQRGIFHLSQGCILFILVRYTSVLAVIFSNWTFFAPLSESTCNRVYLLGIPFKLAGTMVSQVILGTRAYAISRKARWVGWMLGISWLVFSAAEGFVNFWRRTPEVINGHCASGKDGPFRAVWMHYLFAMIFDIEVLVISTAYLWHYSPSTKFMSSLIKRMLFEGVGYFVILTMANALNLIIFNQAALVLQSAGVALGVVIAWIASQRVLITIRESSTLHSSLPHSRSRPTTEDQTSPWDGTIPTRPKSGIALHTKPNYSIGYVDHTLTSPSDIRSQAIRAPDVPAIPQSKGSIHRPAGLAFANIRDQSRSRDQRPTRGSRGEDMELNVTVRVEQTVEVDQAGALREFKVDPDLAYGQASMRSHGSDIGETDFYQDAP